MKKLILVSAMTLIPLLTYANPPPAPGIWKGTYSASGATCHGSGTATLVKPATESGPYITFDGTLTLDGYSDSNPQSLQFQNPVPINITLSCPMGLCTANGHTTADSADNFNFPFGDYTDTPPIITRLDGYRYNVDDPNTQCTIYLLNLVYYPSGHK